MPDSEATTQNHFRPSASLIIAAKSDSANWYDYRVLLFRRTLHTAYAPKHCVFPGGAFEDDADGSKDWLHYFHSMNITQPQLDKLNLNSSHRPQPLMTDGRNFSRDISLRITAIRETFEEVGVLLCRDRNSFSNVNYRNNCNRTGHFEDNFDRALWQKRVHDDPKQFIKLCQFLQVVPDLWSLYEWSIWRSPSTSAKKYDTVFYFVALNEKPKLLLERSEVEIELWHTPSQGLHAFAEHTIWLPPIQYYELSRLTHAQTWAKLLEFAYSRNSKGSTLLQPLYYRCEDGLVGTLAGDTFYSWDPQQHSQTIALSGTIDEFRKKSRHLHRLEIRDMYDINIKFNIDPIDSHLSPIKRQALESKL